jgi:hypothetical protein
MPVLYCDHRPSARAAAGLTDGRVGDGLDCLAMIDEPRLCQDTFPNVIVIGFPRTVSLLVAIERSRVSADPGRDEGLRHPLPGCGITDQSLAHQIIMPGAARRLD